MSLTTLLIVAALGQIKPPAPSPTVAAVKGPPLGYRFIEVAHTKDSFREFHGAPTLNDIGITAFTATMIAGTKVIAYGSGGPLQFAATTADRFTDFEPTPVINDEWQIVFTGHIEGQGSGIFIKPLGADPSVIADTLVDYTRFAGTPDIDGRGAVAFYGEIDTRLPTGIPIPDELRPPDFPDPESASDDNPAPTFMPGMGIFVNNGLETQVVADTLRSFSKVEPCVSISETGAVAYIAVTRSKIRGVFVQRPGPEPVFPVLQNDIRWADFGPPVLTQQGEVCFWAKARDLTEAILAADSNGGLIRTIVNTEPGMQRTFDRVLAHNDRGETLYVAREKSGPVLYLARRSLQTLRVVERGSPMSASTVEEILIAARSLNERGQFCFAVKLKNGEGAIFLATPTR